MSIDIGRAPLVAMPCDSPECGQVTTWRFDRLTAAGFDHARAAAIAADRAFDLHALLDLVDRGCPPELAARIVAPVDVHVQEWR